MAAPDNTVRLAFAGRAFEGWTGFRVTRSMQAGSSVFELSATERFVPRARVFEPGAACELRVGRDVLVTGYVNTVSIRLAADQHSISLSGRDRVGDLIDCSDPLLPPELYNVSLTYLATVLAAPFGVAVRALVDVGANFAKVSINPGERSWEVIEKHCRYRQILPLTDGIGGLLLTRAGLVRAAGTIVEGKNLLSGQADRSDLERFSDYTVKGQSFDLGDGAGSPVGTARDKAVTRYRPLSIVASEAVDQDRCGELARWEALTRAARAEEVQITVQGWRDQAGALWRPNTIVPVLSPVLGLAGDYLVSEVSLSLDSNGTSSALSLMRPDAFKQAPASELDEQDDLFPEV